MQIHCICNKCCSHGDSVMFEGLLKGNVDGKEKTDCQM